jgi:hypothetical protein
VGGTGLEVDLWMKSVKLLDRALRDVNMADSVEMTCYQGLKELVVEFEG